MGFILGFLAIVGGFLFIASKQPSEFRIVRTLLIPAMPSAIFPHVNNLRKWDAWSPWAKIDPSAKNNFEGPEEGVGASMHWAGNRKVGEGRMTITESVPGERIAFRLEFMKPFKATNEAEFTFRQEDGQTLVSWSMYGRNNLVGKAAGLLFNCTNMLNAQFDQGLASLKSVVTK